MEHSPRMKEKQRTNIAKAMGESKYANATFIVGENQTEFKVIRQFLALISPVFDAMLFGPMEEGKAESVITIEDINANDFQSVLNFAYSKDPQITIGNIVSVKSVCRKYDVSGLSAECDEFFEQSINAKSICVLLDEATKYKMDEYVQKCFDKFKKVALSALDIVNSDGFMRMGIESMQLLLQFDYLKISENDLWQKIQQWARQKAKQGESSTTVTGIDEEPPAKRRRLNSSSNSDGNADTITSLELLRAVSPFIRFGLMDIEYFIEKVKPTGCLSKDEVIAVLEYMAMKEKDPKYPCGIFKTEPRKKIFDLTLMKFERFSPFWHRVTPDGMTIEGAVGRGRIVAYWIYPEALEGGYVNGIHFWSVQLVEHYTERSVAVVPSRKSIAEINEQPANDSEAVSMYEGYAVTGAGSWYSGQILTAVLDCDRGAVHYFINEQLKQRDTIEPGKPYWFAMILSARTECFCQVVKTPEAVVAKYE